MNKGKSYHMILVLMILSAVFFADLSFARVLGPGMETMKGIVTAIDLQSKTVTIGNDLFNLGDDPMVLEKLRSKAIKLSDSVSIIYKKSGNEKILISCDKQNLNTLY